MKNNTTSLSTNITDNNLTMLEYLSNERYLQGKELETAEELIKAFRQQKTLSCGFNYDRLFVDGGKQDPNWEIIIQSNRKWNEFETLLKHKAIFIEKYLCIEKSIEQYQKELGSKFYNIINELILIIEKLTRLKCNDWELMIIELRKKVYEFGFRKTCRETKIDGRTLKRILDGEKNIKINQIEKLIIFFNMEIIIR